MKERNNGGNEEKQKITFENFQKQQQILMLRERQNGKEREGKENEMSESRTITNPGSEENT